uniref:Uncharacterized protein n=1 Tax=Glossina austeni TaxID=7395 RepID=A0A1A9V401_GLOAU
MANTGRHNKYVRVLAENQKKILHFYSFFTACSGNVGDSDDKIKELNGEVDETTSHQEFSNANEMRSNAKSSNGLASYGSNSASAGLRQNIEILDIGRSESQ